MVKLVATRPLRYDGKNLEAGDEFEATEKHARSLKAVKRAADAPVPTLREMRNIVAVDPPVPTPVPAVEGEPRSARYNRRDMQAKED